MPTASVIVAVSLVAALGLLTSAWLLLRRKPQTTGFARDCRSVNVSRYRPMLRLLCPDDLDFPARVVPVAGDIAARLRRRHLQLFRAYLAALQADFDLLQDAGHHLIAAGAASPALAESLFRSKIQFSRSLWSIRFRLIGFQLGWTRVDASPLLQAAEQAQFALQPISA
jgi:hypothetical protein